MADTPNPHDALFRLLLEDPQRAHVLLREQLPPAIAARLSESPPKLLDGHFVDERLRNTQSDRLYELRLRDGGAALLYVMLEPKSAPDPRTPLQLLGYMVRIWERHAGTDGRKLRRLPPIFPLVVYHGAAPWRVPTSVLDCLAAGAALYCQAVRNRRAGVLDGPGRIQAGTAGGIEDDLGAGVDQAGDAKRP